MRFPNGRKHRSDKSGMVHLTHMPDMLAGQPRAAGCGEGMIPTGRESTQQLAKEETAWPHPDIHKSRWSRLAYGIGPTAPTSLLQIINS